MLEEGIVEAVPQTYEDFLPVSAAGIFQSNLGGREQKIYSASAAQAEFERAIGCKVLDEVELYDEAQARSLAALREAHTRSQPRAAP